MHMSAAVNAVADDAAVGAAAASEIEELYMAAWADNALVHGGCAGSGHVWRWWNAWLLGFVAGTDPE